MFDAKEHAFHHSIVLWGSELLHSLVFIGLTYDGFLCVGYYLGQFNLYQKETGLALKHIALNEMSQSSDCMTNSHTDLKVSRIAQIHSIVSLYSHKKHLNYYTRGLNCCIRNYGWANHTGLKPWKGDICLYLEGLLRPKCYKARPTSTMLHLRGASRQMFSCYCILTHPQVMFSIVAKSPSSIWKMRNCFKCNGPFPENVKIIPKFILEEKNVK